MPRYYQPLGALVHADLAEAGGKAVNLGELIGAGLPTPGGFCLLTSAYREFVRANQLQPCIDEILTAAHAADPRQLAASGANIRQRFTAAPVPPLLITELTEIHELLRGRPLAVRSSATAEDLPGASFAGQHDTYLNVLTLDGLLARVRACWASLWNDRAIAYRARNGIDSAQVALAVVIQPLLEAEVAGVMFSANPLNGRRDQLTIDASYGLGEAIVSGAVTPDSFLIARPQLTVVSRSLGSKRLSIRPKRDGGTSSEPLGEEAAGAACLSDDQLQALARLGERVEAHFGAPQDIEWALAEGRFHILQSRPITSLYPPFAAHPDGRRHYYISISAAQGLLEPFTPLGVSFLQELWRRVPILHDGHQLRLQVLEGRIFLDVTDLMATPAAGPLTEAVLPEVEPVIGRILSRLRTEGAFAQVERDAFVANVRRFAWRNRANLAWLLSHNLLNLLRPRAARHRLRRDVIPTLLQLRRQLNATAITPAATGQAVDGLFALFSRSRLPFHLVTRVAPGVAAFKLVESMLEGAGLSTGQLLAARQALPHNVTTNMALELATLARQIDRDERSRAALTTLADAELARWLAAGKLPPVLQNGARRFLRRYGHRAVREIDLGVPRWREEPHYLFAVLRSHLDNPNDPTQHFRQQTAAAERAAGAVARQLRGAPGGWYKARVAAWLLRQYRQLGGLREMPKFYIVWGLGEVRRCCQRLGGALVEAGRLDRPADVFFLTFPELRRADFDDLDLRALVQERRAAYEQALRRRRAPRVLADNGEEFHGAAGGSAAQGWQGTAASPGIQRGRVRVVRDPSTPLRAGEVLVAPSTDPAWTPLFLTACALVMEAGGMMSHGSIVAREYGIPAVVGLAGATELLHDGDLVEVDGAAGVVRLLTPAAAVAAP